MEKVSDYIDGHFRVTFSGAADLEHHIQNALRPLVTRQEAETMTSNQLDGVFDRPHVFSQDATGRLALVPDRNEEVFSPMQLESDDFARRLFELGHAKGVDLFSYSSGKQVDIKDDFLVILQDGRGSRRDNREQARVQVGEQGLILIDGNVTERSGRRNGFSDDIFTVSADDIAAFLTSAFKFAGAVFDEFDPHKRHQRFFYNVAITGLGHKKIVRQRSRSGSMGNNDKAPMTAHSSPQLLSRDELRNPGETIERILTKLIRKSDA